MKGNSTKDNLIKAGKLPNDEIKSRVKNSGFQDDETGMYYPHSDQAFWDRNNGCECSNLCDRCDRIMSTRCVHFNTSALSDKIELLWNDLKHLPDVNTVKPRYRIKWPRPFLDRVTHTISGDGCYRIFMKSGRVYDHLCNQIVSSPGPCDLPECDGFGNIKRGY